jgi:parvulin-like peptidyl-prolyl isomerase
MAAAVAIGTSACHLSPYAAIVNGQVISQQQLDSELQAIQHNRAYAQRLQSQGLPIQGQGQDSFDTRFADAVLNQDILFTLIQQAVSHRHVPITSSDLRSARADLISSYGGAAAFDAFPPSYRDQLVRDSAEVTALEASLGKVSVSSGSLHRYYRSHRSQFRTVCVSVVLVPTMVRAQQAERALRQGISFSKVSRNFSVDPYLRANGGAIGCALPQQFSSRLGSRLGHALASLGRGQVTAPIHIQPGWVVATVTSSKALPFAQAGPAIRASLLQGSTSRVSAYLETLTRRATVTVDPRYGSFKAKGAASSVQPPRLPPTKDLALPNGITPNGNATSTAG